MLASAGSIIALAQTIVQAIDTGSQLATAIIPRVMLLKSLLLDGEKTTVEKLAKIRADNDALDARIEAQTEEGK